VLEFAIFFLFAAVAVIGALTVILHKNPVVGAISLVGSLFSLAVMYVLLEAPFIAALQVIIYAGAIMVLFLFVIMLLNLQHEEEPTTRPIQRFLGVVAPTALGITLIYFILKSVFVEADPTVPYPSDVRSIGFRLFEAYIFPFEMVSILLLAAIVGALVITQRDRTNPPIAAIPSGTPDNDSKEVTP
jgi:NADH-quinone oxidoreductase subunit J